MSDKEWLGVAPPNWFRPSGIKNQLKRGKCLHKNGKPARSRAWQNVNICTFAAAWHAKEACTQKQKLQKVKAGTRVTRYVCDKVAQTVAQPIFKSKQIHKWYVGKKLSKIFR
jgi:hypothetical protein